MLIEKGFGSVDFVKFVALLKKMKIVPNIDTEKNAEKIRKEIMSIEGIGSLIEKIENNKIIFRKNFGERDPAVAEKKDKMKTEIDQRISSLAKQKALDLVKNK